MDSGNVDIVLVRMDKIGDLVLTLPVDQHPALQGQRVHWLITQGLGFIAQQSVPQRAASEFKRSFSILELMRLVRWFRRQNPRCVILLHNPWWVSCAAWLAGVPERSGRLSQWHSFLFLNLPIQQKRSLSDRHESAFNFDMVEWIFNRLGVRPALNLDVVKKTYLHLKAPSPMATLATRGLMSKRFRVVHPGMAGSALNWPTDNYQALIEKLAADLPVVITGTKADRKYLDGLKGLREHPQVRWLVGELSMSELFDLLAEARSVIAPSTGVLHLAASLGTPALGIYSPRQVEHPRRWGPKGSRVAVLVPQGQVEEPIDEDVMRLITVDQVFQSTLALEAGGDSTPAHFSV